MEKKNYRQMNQKKMFSAIFASLIVFASILFSLNVVSAYASPAPINLGTADNFVILAKSGISTTGTTSIVGNIGLSPAAATFITGFGLTMDSSNTFSTSSLITGQVYASDYTPPTPAVITTAIGNMETAYTAAASPAPDATELGAGNIGGMTLAPGVYKWSSGLTIPSDLTLDAQGNSNAVWIFQIAQTLTVSNGVHINLINGARASNIFWQVAGQTTLGTTSVFNGNILDQTAIVLNTGAVLNGRALAQTAVTLDSNTVTSAGGAPATNPSASSNNGNSGSNRGSNGCDANWACSAWSACSNGLQTRTCENTNGLCDTMIGEPALTQSCTVNANNQPQVTPTGNPTNTVGATTPLTGDVIGNFMGLAVQVWIFIAMGLLIMAIIVVFLVRGLRK